MQDKEYFSLLLTVSKTFSYSEYHTDSIIKASDNSVYCTPFSFVQKITVDNQMDRDYPVLILRFSFSSPIFSPCEMLVYDIKKRAKQIVRVDPNIRVDQEKLYKLNGIEVCQVQVDVYEKDSEEPLCSVSKVVKILPFNQASSEFDSTGAQLLSKFCVTGFPELDQIHMDAVKLNDNQPLLAYQNENKNQMVHELSLLYAAVHKYGIVYSNPPHSTEKMQNVRLPQEVLSSRFGTCLDLSILFCSLLLSVGYHPILILTYNHAFCGVFLEENAFYSFLTDKPSVVYSDATGNTKKVLLFETTTVCASSSTSFAEAINNGQENLRGYRGSFFAVDVNFCQRTYYKPLPMPKEGGEVDYSISPAALDEKELEEIKDYVFNPVTEREDKDRFSTWEKKLLDLNASNRLVNFRSNGDNHCPLAIPSGEEFYDFLRSNSKGSFKLRCLDNLMTDESGKMTKLDVTAAKMIGLDLFKKGSLLGMGRNSTVKKLLKMDKTAREETGSPTLYLALGMLTGNDSGRYLSAPFLLLPLSLSKDRYGDQFTATYDFDSLMINLTFFEYYKLKKGADFSLLYGVDGTYQYRDIVASLQNIKIGDVSIDPDKAFLANFSFSHYVMWQDIKRRKNVLSDHPVIASLLKNESLIENDSATEGRNADEIDTMHDFAAPLPYDSTQLKAILEAGKKNSFILDGPPGTGKSQTIVNMIVNAFYQGKTVLFVAEKQAALDVVKNRLKTLGLDRFALQLYSPKENKQSLFKQLGASMDLGKQAGQGDFEGTCQAIEKEKASINEELKKLHQHNGHFFSLYEAIAKRLSSEQGKGYLAFDYDFIESYDADKDQDIRARLSSVVSLAHSIPDFAKTPLMALRLHRFGYEDQESIGEFFSSLLKARKSLDASLSRFASYFHLSNGDEARLLEVAHIYDLVLNKGAKPEKVSNLPLSSAYLAAFLCLKRIASGELRPEEKVSLKMDFGIAMREKLLSEFKEEALEKLDLDLLTTLSSKKGLFKVFSSKKALKYLAPYRKTPNDPLSLSLKDIATSLREYRRFMQEEEKALVGISSFFDKDPFEVYKDKESCYDVYKATEELSSCLQAYSTPRFGDGDPFLESFHPSYSTLCGLSEPEKASARKEVEALLNASSSFNEQEKITKARFPYSLPSSITLEDLVSNIDRSENLAIIHRLALLEKEGDRLSLLGLSSFFESIRAGEVPLDLVEYAYDYALSNAFIRKYFVSDSYNDDFSVSAYEARIASYQELIRRYSAICVEQAVEKVSSSFPSSKTSYSASSPIGELRKLVMNSGRGISIRNALTKYEDYFRAYFLCFLMSPLSVAQYLDVSSKRFDIVIFDEASQIPTAEAVGPIARGDALVVSGDPEQMPPSDYFSVSLSSEDDDQMGQQASLEDADSLLDDCLSIEMPRIRLAFHYRSRHESLIAFSNLNFYGGDLYTFPSVDNLTSHISFKEVQPLSKSSSAISKEEISAVLSTLEEIYTDPATKGKSTGIIVFNLSQQDKLSDAIEEFMTSHPVIATLSHYNEEDNPNRLFVKNLENVQGDERDIIILCVGFSRTKAGKAELGGPLMRNNGERRLNVACSRSKEYMIVISTINSSDIDDAKYKNLGAKRLKQFLSYAKNASEPSASLSRSSGNNVLAASLKKELEQEGYLVDLGVGGSEFKIDLGVRNKTGNGYALGILLDENPVNPHVSVRDRFYVEPMMLSSLSWKLLRVYTCSFLRFKKQTILSIIDKIEQASSDSPLLPNFKPVLVDANEEFDYQIVPYVESDLSTSFVHYKGLTPGFFDSYFGDVLHKIVADEGPIAYNVLKARAKKVLGVTQMKGRAEDILLFHLARLSFPKTDDHLKNQFYWPYSNSSHRVDNFRSSDRDILDIPKEEILCLANRIILAQVKIKKEDLIRLLAEKMGFATISSRVRNKLVYCLDYGKENNLLAEGYLED